MAISSLPEFPQILPNYLVPADRRFVEVDEDLLGLQIFFESPRAQLTTEPGLFVASPGSFHIGWLHVVDPDDSSAHGFYDAKRLEDVSGPDCSGQSIRRVVGDADRVRFVFERDHRSYGAKNFLAGDAGIVIHVIKNGGLNVVALAESLWAAATDGGLGLFPAKFQVRADAVVLFLAD